MPTLVSVMTRFASFGAGGMMSSTSISCSGRPLRGLLEIALDAVHAFRAAGARAAAHPFELVLEKHLPLVLDALLGGLALRLGDEVIVVTAVVVDEIRRATARRCAWRCGRGNSGRA